MTGAHLAQELWDEIIDYLAVRPTQVHHLADLKSASSINRSCVARAQSHIFRSVSVRKIPGRPRETMAVRLCLSMKTSPHLIRYVRNLEIYDPNPRILAAMGDIPWSHVERLTFGRTNAMLSPADIDKIGVLVRLSSLRSLVFRSADWSVHQWYGVFSRCATGIQDLAFQDCITGSVPTPVLRPKASLQPTSLSITPTWPIIELLTQSDCPIDLSQLKHIYCAGMRYSTSNGLMRSIGAGVTRLSLNGRDRTLELLDITCLPLLTQIDVFDAHIPFYRLMARLPLNNRITVITLLCYGGASNVEVQSLLLSGILPNLRNVNLQILECPPEIEAYAAAFKDDS